MIVFGISPIEVDLGSLPIDEDLGISAYSSLTFEGRLNYSLDKTLLKPPIVFERLVRGVDKPRP